jgi:hypothetical protein
VKRSIITALGLMALSGFCARDASAFDYGNYFPGLNCKYYGKQGSDSYFDPNGFTANGLKNTDASSRYAVCPLTRNAMGIDAAGIFLSTSSDVCKLYIKNTADLSQTIISRTSKSTNSDTGLTTHMFQVSEDDSYTLSETLTLYCNIPAGAVIREYWLQENIL